MKGGGEVTKTPQIWQGGSAVTLRLKQDAWGDCKIAARSPLDQEIAAISEKFLSTSLKFWGDHMIGKKRGCHHSVTER